MNVLLQTPRLILRELLEEDVDGIFQLDSDPQVATYLGNNPISTVLEAQEIIKYIQNQYVINGIGRWAVLEKSTHSFIGWAGYKLITDEVNSRTGFYDLGYRFIKSAWNKGYASEVAIALVDYGWNTLKLSEINAIADSGNSASIKVLEKAGLKITERFEYNGAPHYWFSLLK